WFRHSTLRAEPHGAGNYGRAFGTDRVRSPFSLPRLRLARSEQLVVQLGVASRAVSRVQRRPREGPRSLADRGALRQKVDELLRSAIERLRVEPVEHDARP